MTSWFCRATSAVVAGMFVVTLGSSTASADMPSLDGQAIELQEKAQTTQMAYDEARLSSAAAAQHLLSIRAQAGLAATAADEAYAKAQEDAPGLFGKLSGWVTGSESALDRAAEASSDAEHLQELVAIAHSGLDDAQTEVDRARRAMNQAMSAADEMTVAASARAAATIAKRQAQFASTYSASSSAQDRRNTRALARWESYLTDLALAPVLPPDSSEVARPADLDDKYRRVSDDHGRAVPGVAQFRTSETDSVLVLPAPTVRAISEAFSKVGDVEDAEPGSLDCGDLVYRVWSTARVRVPADNLDQWQQLHAVAKNQMQPGDSVYLGTESDYESGIYLGNKSMISTVDGEVAVRPVPFDQVLGASRTTLSANDPISLRTVPVELEGGSCQVVEAPEAPAEVSDGGVLGLPMVEASYTLSSGFGQSGSLWSSGQHTGQDFAAPSGTSVLASAAGVVSVSAVSWAGDLVTIDHGNGLETTYAHMSRIDVQTGEQVAAGEVIGGVGDRGNTTGPHLHFEVHIDGTSVDPMPMLDADAGAGTGNGMIPTSSLCAVSDGGQLLQCTAAAAYRSMDAAYEDEFGGPLCVTDSYRSLQVQQQLAITKPTLAAVPGTSNHGWGRAVDLCGGVETFGTPEHEWLVANADRFGWEHPSWAGAGGSRPEPWHFEFSTV